MRKFLGMSMVIAVAVLLNQGCLSARLAPEYQTAQLDTHKYVKKVDQFAVIVDSSQSMGNPSKAERKLDISGAFLEKLAQSIPEFGYTGELRLFGHGSCSEKGKTVELSPMSKYSKSAFEQARADYNCAAGYSPLYRAIEASGSQLSTRKIPSALVVITDGLHMGEKELDAVRDLKAKLGSALNVYAVQIGHDAKGKSFLEKLVAAGGEGKLYQDADLTGSDAMADFVTEVFLYPDDDGDGVPNHLDKCPNTPAGVKVDANGCCLDTDHDGVPDFKDKCPNTPAGVKVDADGCCLDTDHDGVPDFKDKCPNTPAGAKVDANGCCLDSDGDGVPDYRDKCPNTPAGAPVDETGCPVEGITVIGDSWSVQGKVLFDLNKSTIKPEAIKVLNKIAAYLNKHPEMKVEVRGYTDSTGPHAWNMKLSQRRADAVRDYLAGEGVPTDRLSTNGYGPDNPIASNDTKEGRALNRRVDFHPVQ